MATPMITIKRTKLTLKAPVAESAAVSEPAASDDKPAGATPAEVTKSSKGDIIFQAIGLVFAVLAVVLFVALLFMQMSELSYYKDAIPEFATPSAARPAAAPAAAATPAPVPVAVPAPAPAAGATPAAGAATPVATATPAAAPVSPAVPAAAPAPGAK